jgi:catechol 2,3-dioxygenase-like lactoylglutathione lyase family enzyme
VRATVDVAPRVTQVPAGAVAYNGPGRIERTGARAPGVLRTERVQPRKLGHTVLGTTDLAVTRAFFLEGLGFKLSDAIKDVGAFMRCSTDHHNVLVLQAPIGFLHHTSWQVDDVDEVGRGASAMLADHPERHIWGLGRHHAGSNFFWYLKDPAGNFSEYYSDLDCIVDDYLWTPETFDGAQGLFNWGPPPPPSFLAPDDLAALMTGLHSKGRA